MRNTNSEAQAAVSSNKATAQEKQTCTLTLAGAPTIHGIKLGMSKQEVLSLFPGDKEGAEIRATLAQPAGRFGMTSLDITPVESKDRFNGIRHVTLRLVDGRVYNFRISYDGPAWPNVDEFVGKFVDQTNLPRADQWEAYVGMDTQLKTLSCSGFAVQLFAGGSDGNLNYADITDVAANKALRERRAKARAQASPTSAAHD
jgi:hypothetical protein